MGGQGGSAVLPAKNFETAFSASPRKIFVLPQRWSDVREQFEQAIRQSREGGKTGGHNQRSCTVRKKKTFGETQLTAVSVRKNDQKLNLGRT